MALRLGVGDHTTLATALKPIGELWLNGLRMTLVPLVFCLMASGMAGIADTATGGGRVVGIAVAVFVALLFVASIAGTLTVKALMLLWPVHPLGLTSASSSAGATAASPDFIATLTSLVPVNPVAAAAEAAMAPLIVFAAIFGLAISRLPPPARSLLVNFFAASSDAMLVIVQWVLRVAPIGIFVLSFEAAASVGVGAALGVFQYVVLLSAAVVVGLGCAILVGLSSGVAPTRFFRAALAPQALAASTQSSMACLPALVEAAEALKLPRPFVGSIMPLAVTTFRFGNVFGGLAAGLIGASLFGVHPGVGAIGLAIIVGVLSNIGSVGLPGQAVLLAAYGPIFTALGAPIEALMLLLPVFALPDILITVCNVTGHLGATSLIARLAGQEPSP